MSCGTPVTAEPNPVPQQPQPFQPAMTTPAPDATPAIPDMNATQSGPVNPSDPDGKDPDSLLYAAHKEDTTQKRHSIICIIIVTVLVVALIGGLTTWTLLNKRAADAEEATSAAAAKTVTKPKKQPANQPVKPEKPKTVSEVTMANVDCGSQTTTKWGWTGGALASEVVQCTSSDSSSSYGSDTMEGEYAFGVWTPALDQSTEIRISMLETGEKEYSKPVVAATYGDEPTVFVLYAVKTKAVGTQPETVHLYAHQVDLETGKFSDRIDLRTQEDNLIDYQQGYKFSVIASSEKTVAVAKSWHSDDKFTVNGDNTTRTVNHTQVMGVTRDADTATALQTFKDDVTVKTNQYNKQYLGETSIKVSESSAADIYLVSMRGNDGNDSSSYRLFSIDDNRNVLILPYTYCDPNKKYGCNVDAIRHFASGKYFIEAGGDAERYGVIADAQAGVTSVGSIMNLGESDSISNWDQFHDGSLYFEINGSNDDKRIMVIGIDGKASEILNNGRWARLLLNSGKPKGINYISNLIYAQTTDQQISVDLQGNTVSQDVTALPYTDNGSECDHTAVDWVMWQGDFSSSSSDSSSYSGSSITTVVTRGQAPGDPAPTSDE